MYGKVVQEIPKDDPDLLQNEIVTTTFLDANLMHDVLTGQSVTAMLHFFNTTPGDWYSKRKVTVENATYGSEFAVAKTATEQVIEIRQDLSSLESLSSQNHTCLETTSLLSQVPPFPILCRLKDITLCLTIESERLLLPRSSPSIGVILPRMKVISSVSIGTTQKFTILTEI